MTDTRNRILDSVKAGLVAFLIADVAWALSFVVVNNLYFFTSDFSKIAEIVFGLFFLFIGALFFPFDHLDFFAGWYSSLKLFIWSSTVVAGVSIALLDWLRQASKFRQIQIWFVAISGFQLSLSMLQLIRVFNEPIEVNLRLAIMAFGMQVLILIIWTTFRYRRILFQKAFNV